MTSNPEGFKKLQGLMSNIKKIPKTLVTKMHVSSFMV